MAANTPLHSHTHGHRVDIIDRLMADHRKFDALFLELERQADSPQHQRRLADVVIAELVRHSAAEEQYLYPAARKILPDANLEANHEISKHAAAERIMKQWENVDPSSPEFDKLSARLAADVRNHISYEENSLFPKLQLACSKEELVKLGNRVKTAKKFAPTRPHPSAPDTPPWNKIFAPGTAVVDKIRDALKGRPTTPQDISRQEQ